ncbi:hypothetical protein VTH06DRAFT_2658 [Thermothelomyces fergusii]
MLACSHPRGFPEVERYLAGQHRQLQSCHLPAEEGFSFQRNPHGSSCIANPPRGVGIAQHRLSSPAAIRMQQEEGQQHYCGTCCLRSPHLSLWHPGQRAFRSRTH